MKKQLEIHVFMKTEKLIQKKKSYCVTNIDMARHL